jgi:PAS domain S-box-containing protein
MAEPSTLELLARRLNYAGLALLAGAALAFVWAVGFTRGVDGLLEGLVVAAIGLFLPGIAALWVSSIIGSAAAAHPRPPRHAEKRLPWLSMFLQYAAAVLAVAVATLVRLWLAPYVGNSVPYPAFYLAVVAATWIGGIGAGGLAAVLSVLAVWYIAPQAAAATPQTGHWIGAALFLTVALAMSGVTSALRVARSGGIAMRTALDLAAAERDEIEALLRTVADEVPAMLWLSTADGRCTHVNEAWRSFTGQPLDAALGDGWLHGVHPDDLGQWRELFDSASRKRQRFTVEYRRKRHDGTYRRVVDNAAPRLFGERGFAGFVGRTSEPGHRAREPLPTSEAGPGTPESGTLR